MLSPRGLEMINSMGDMVFASMYPVSRIVVKRINCEYTSNSDSMLLLRTLRYGFCKCSVILEHRYSYTKRILNKCRTIIANIEVCFIQMQCVIDALMLFVSLQSIACLSHMRLQGTLKKIPS